MIDLVHTELNYSVHCIMMREIIYKALHNYFNELYLFVKQYFSHAIKIQSHCFLSVDQQEKKYRVKHFFCCEFEMRNAHLRNLKKSVKFI